MSSQLTDFTPVFDFYTPEIVRGFLTFSKDTEMNNWLKMS